MAQNCSFLYIIFPIWRTSKQGKFVVKGTLMPYPFTGPKMFWAGPNILCQTKNLTAFSATPNFLCQH